MDSMLKKYAQLLMKCGVNLQPGQPIIIHATTEDVHFARILCDAAYDIGASNVILNWEDEYIKQARFLRAANETFDTAPPWLAAYYDYYDDLDACALYLDSNDPTLLKDVEASRLQRNQSSRNKALTRHRNMQMDNNVRWCVAPSASLAWARKVFPHENNAVNKLWEKLAHAIRLDCSDAIKAWEEHVNSMQKRLNFLNSRNIQRLVYKNSIGTDVTIEMPDNSLWLGGKELSTKGIEFCANIPTEELFSAPKRTGVNGRIVASMPLIYNGVEIDGFEFEFKNGKVVSFSANKNEDTLRGILEMDDGASMLGEVALVPYDSPICSMGILFYNTLLDENASCHFALGKAYPCIKNAVSMSRDELKAAGLNDSITHVDFMVGTPDLSITGVTVTGEQLAIFRDGCFCF